MLSSSPTIGQIQDLMAEIGWRTNTTYYCERAITIWSNAILTFDAMGYDVNYVSNIVNHYRPTKIKIGQFLFL